MHSQQSMNDSRLRGFDVIFDQHLFATSLVQSLVRRFMGIAEQMGKVLQRTSISVNIKERLDFSCALFGSDGSLVKKLTFHLPFLIPSALAD